MKLLRLTLRNFKGIKSFTLDTQGEDVNIFGDNATGKTTLFDAFVWLLFDKDSQNRKDFEIKTLDADRHVIHGLDHEVEAVLDLAGRQVTLRKVYKEKWAKKRGSATAEFTGHTTDYFIDGVPVKKAEYDTRIASICDETVFKLLTNPTYFNEQLHWQERRQILLEVCGDISDGDVIASDPALAKLPEILQGRRLEDHRKVIQVRRTEINRELEKVPVRIDEVQRGLPKIDDIVPEVLADDIAKLRAERQAKGNERTRLEAGGEITEKQRRLAEIDSELLEIENKYRFLTNSAIQEAAQKLADAEDQRNAASRELWSLDAQIQDNRNQIERLEQQVKNLRERWYQYNNLTFEHKQDSTCPTCGQAIPEEQLAEAREKALAAFNAGKAERLEAISVEGKELRARINELEQAIDALLKERQKAETELASWEKEVAEVQRTINDLRNQSPDVTKDAAYQQKQAERAAVEREIAQLRESTADAVAAVAAEVERLDQAIRALEATVLRIDQHKCGKARIEELKAQERALAAEYERLEGELYLCEQFVRTKVNLLEDRINSRFKLARFKLFNILINGGVEECCETTYHGVPYGSLNHGARLNVGIDICNTLAEHYGFAPPIFVDNAEAVTQLIPTRGQMIKLVVSGADKALRVEVEIKNKNVERMVV